MSRWRIFYRNIEEEYGTVFGDNFDWEHFHFKFLIYYLVRVWYWVS